MSIEADYQIVRLSDRFYVDYPNSRYPEILTNNKRSYCCLLFQTAFDYFVCVPFRSNIQHRYSFRFRHSVRSRIHPSGLDYTKIVIIKNDQYIDNSPAIIDTDEFRETKQNIEKIKSEVLIFINDYINHINGTYTLRQEEFNRRYGCSPLQYFHRELNLP